MEFFFDKVPDLQACHFIKKRLQHRCFPMKFAKSKEHLVLQNTSGGWLLLKYFVRILLVLAMRRLHVAYWKHCYDCSLSIFNYNCILVCEISFSIFGTLKINYPRVLAKGVTLCSIDRSNQPL